MLQLNFQTGEPPECGRYIVTDGEEVNVDYWWEYINDRARLPSDIGKPGKGTVARRWGRYENVIAWAPTILKGQHDRT